MYTDAEEFAIHDVHTQQMNVFDRSGNAYQVTQVRMYVGDHGPFSQLFGPNQQYADDIAQIQLWKTQTVAKVQQTVKG